MRDREPLRPTGAQAPPSRLLHRVVGDFVSGLIHDQSGASTLEVVLVLPVALSLMIGIAAFGHGFAAYHQADKGVRAAARYLARVPDSAVESWGIENARDIALYGCVMDDAKSKCRDAASGDAARPMLVQEWGEDGVIDVNYNVIDAGTQTHIEVSATVNWPVLLGGVFGVPLTFNYTVSHREPQIGE